MRVAVRVRPMSKSEQLEGCKVVLSCGDHSPEHSSASATSGSTAVAASTSTSTSSSTKQIFVGNASDRSFTFDEVFGSAVSQAQVFSSCVSPLLERFMEGYNGTILAYGQTGSGKTFTMGTATTGAELMGAATAADLKDPALAIIPRAAITLFEAFRVLEEKAHRLGLARPVFELRTSFLEIYNEELIDLLDKEAAGPVRIQEDHGGGGVQLIGLTEEMVTSPAALLACLARGALSRTTAATDMNKTSSRSHGQPRLSS